MKFQGRARSIYVADADIQLWDESARTAEKFGLSLSKFVADALRNQLHHIRQRQAIPNDVAVRYVQTRLGDYQPE